MVNESFSVLSEHERSSKLRTVLKNRSEGRISESEIRAVMDVISLKKQYAIRIYVEPDEFRKSLVLADPSRSKTVFGSAIAGVPGLSERFFPGRMQPHTLQRTMWILSISTSRSNAC